MCKLPHSRALFGGLLGSEMPLAQAAPVNKELFESIGSAPELSRLGAPEEFGRGFKENRCSAVDVVHTDHGICESHLKLHSYLQSTNEFEPAGDMVIS